MQVAVVGAIVQNSIPDMGSGITMDFALGFPLVEAECEIVNVASFRCGVGANDFFFSRINDLVKALLPSSTRVFSLPLLHLHHNIIVDFFAGSIKCPVNLAGGMQRNLATRGLQRRRLMYAEDCDKRNHE